MLSTGRFLQALGADIQQLTSDIVTIGTAASSAAVLNGTAIAAATAPIGSAILSAAAGVANIADALGRGCLGLSHLIFAARYEALGLGWIQRCQSQKELFLQSFFELASAAGQGYFGAQAITATLNGLYLSAITYTFTGYAIARGFDLVDSLAKLAMIPENERSRDHWLDLTVKALEVAAWTMLAAGFPANIFICGVAATALAAIEAYKKLNRSGNERFRGTTWQDISSDVQHCIKTPEQPSSPPWNGTFDRDGHPTAEPDFAIPRYVK